MLQIPDIVTSVKIPQLIKDEVIRQGTPVCDERNRPYHKAGGFAVVFPFDVDGRKWAFRCWSAKLEGIEDRLNKISQAIHSLNLPYFCDFTYKSQGLVVNGEPVPTTRMQWIDGLNIKEYICKYYRDAQRLEKLAKDFLDMCNKLHECHIAHGDLQHGNILVDSEGKLYLIDYDSMFVPALEGESDIITGLVDYQHPSRCSNKIISSKIDYFSELIIYLSILAIKERPSLIETYQVEDSDRLLFCKDDFTNLKQSEIYTDLMSLSKEIKELLDVLSDYLHKKNIDELGPFSFYQKLKKYGLSYGMQLYCINCGTRYSCIEDNLFCINCGKELAYG